MGLAVGWETRSAVRTLGGKGVAVQRVMQCWALTAAAVLLVTAVPASAAIRIPSLTRYGPPLHLNEAQRFSPSVPRRTTLQAELAAVRPSLSSRFAEEQALSSSTEPNQLVRKTLEKLADVAEEAFKEAAGYLQDWAVDEVTEDPPDFDDVMYYYAKAEADRAFPFAEDYAIERVAGYVTAHADEVAEHAFEDAVDEPSQPEPTYVGASDASSDNSALTAIAVGGGALVGGVLLVAYFARRRSG